MDVDYSPEKAVDDCPTTFWNAGHRWKPGDHLEVTFSSPQLIDCLMLKERPDLQRIREYSLTYQNTNGEWQEIVRHKGGLNGKMMQHRFAPICAVKLRFVLWKTVEVPSASNESGLSHFEAYCNE